MSSQGLKATCLSWTMKAGIPDPDQTLLGYHSRGRSASALSYGRDSLAGPLRQLQSVLQDIRTGKFRPDSTRSGRWSGLDTAASLQSTASAPERASTANKPPPAQSSSASSSESEPVSDGSSGEDVQLLQSVCHSLALVAESPDFQFLTNIRSGVVHVSRLHSDRLLCGRTVFAGLKVTSTVDFAKCQACLTCQSVADGLIGGQWAGLSLCSTRHRRGDVCRSAVLLLEQPAADTVTFCQSGPLCSAVQTAARCVLQPHLWKRESLICICFPLQ